MTFFVHILSSDLQILIESCFYLSYYANIQPSEVDKLTTFEFNKYMELLNKSRERDREEDVNLAKLSSFGGLLGGN